MLSIQARVEQFEIPASIENMRPERLIPLLKDLLLKDDLMIQVS
jgi:hypothetical protein